MKLNNKGITLATTVVIICVLLLIVLLVTVLYYNFEKNTTVNTLNTHNNVNRVLR